jgi:hypothetical protein
MFQECSEQAGWLLLRFRSGQEFTRIRSAAGGQGRGLRKGYFVLVPSIASDRPLDLSVQGDRYRLRDFVGNAGGTTRGFIVPPHETFVSLQESNLISRWSPVREDDLCHSLEREPEYWENRMRMLSIADLKPFAIGSQL